jgi:hypothetical protein
VKAVDDLETERNRQGDEEQKELPGSERVEDFQYFHGYHFLRLFPGKSWEMNLRRPGGRYKDAPQSHAILTL